VAVDPTGRAPGRGAYVHLTEECAQGAVRSGGLARALRTPLSGAEAARLLEELRAELGMRTGEPTREGEEP
jgi:predicted RNA-binding protein YlxR (DUF448 family)